MVNGSAVGDGYHRVLISRDEEDGCFGQEVGARCRQGVAIQRPAAASGAAAAVAAPDVGGGYLAGAGGVMDGATAASVQFHAYQTMNAVVAISIVLKKA